MPFGRKIRDREQIFFLRKNMSWWKIADRLDEIDLHESE